MKELHRSNSSSAGAGFCRSPWKAVVFAAQWIGLTGAGGVIALAIEFNPAANYLMRLFELPYLDDWILVPLSIAEGSLVLFYHHFFNGFYYGV